jgi:hypothetical protein
MSICTDFSILYISLILYPGLDKESGVAGLQSQFDQLLQEAKILFQVCVVIMGRGRDWLGWLGSFEIYIRCLLF